MDHTPERYENVQQIDSAKITTFKKDGKPMLVPIHMHNPVYLCEVSMHNSENPLASNSRIKAR